MSCWLPTPINLGLLKAQDQLLAYKEAPIADYDKATYDKDMTFFGTKGITTGSPTTPTTPSRSRNGPTC